MKTVIVDYNSGNLRSAEKSFQRMAEGVPGSDIIVTNKPEIILTADRIVLPGVGAFAECRAGLSAIDGLFEAIQQRVISDGIPFLGICVGMQMMASHGLEHGQDCPGFNWIKGEVTRITPRDPALKIPHMGWNDFTEAPDHPVFAGISSGDHVYFVHSYHMHTIDPVHGIAHVDYGGPITAAVARGNMVGVQFHPEKSQQTGLKLIDNFLRWSP